MWYYKIKSVIIMYGFGEKIRECTITISYQERRKKNLDLHRLTQYSGGYIRWIKFFVNVIGEIAKQFARLFTRSENAIAEDEKVLDETKAQARSV